MTWLLGIEIVSTITGILCVWLQTKEKILAWPFGIISVSLAAIIFGNSRLYSDLILHLAFLGLNIYGWIKWSQYSPSEDKKPIEILSQKMLWLYAIIITLGSIIWGWIMGKYTDADLPYFDSFTTVGSLTAQYLLSKKVLQNWLIWIIVDVVAVNIYLYKGLYFFSFLFVVYLLICIKGYRDWTTAKAVDR